MRDDLIARLERAATSYERNAECGATSSSVQNEQFTAALFREALAALTAQGETAPATDHTAARTKVREWLQDDARAAQAEADKCPTCGECYAPHACSTHRRAQEETAPAPGDEHAKLVQAENSKSDAVFFSVKVAAASRLCARGEHEWCFNRSAEETRCSCPCHTKRAARPAAEGLEQLAKGAAETILAQSWVWTNDDTRVDYMSGVILAALRGVAEGRR